MKKKILLSVALLGLLVFNSCLNQGSKKVERKELKKQSVWSDSLRNDFTKKNATIAFEKFVLNTLIDENEFEKNYTDLSTYIKTKEFAAYKKTKTKEFVINADDLTSKSKAEIEKILGKPNYKEKVNPSRTPCPCDKHRYINDLIEIVFINEKSDWITIHNTSSFVKVDETKYESVNKFENYIYIKVKTK